MTTLRYFCNKAMKCCRSFPNLLESGPCRAMISFNFENPPIGTRSDPVANRSRQRFCSSVNAWTVSQKFLQHKKWRAVIKMKCQGTYRCANDIDAKYVYSKACRYQNQHCSIWYQFNEQDMEQQRGWRVANCRAVLSEAIWWKEITLTATLWPPPSSFVFMQCPYANHPG